MSIAELKATADNLTAEERAWLTRYLATLNRINDPAFLAEVTRRNVARVARATRLAAPEVRVGDGAAFIKSYF